MIGKLKMVATNYQRSGLNFKPLILLMALGILAGIILSTHATDRHGSDAERIRECLEQNGYTQQWQHNSDKDVYVFCAEFDDCTMGIMIAQVWNSITGKTFRERTSFFPADGQQCNVEKYLSKFATRVK